jgi:hypothetical protein
VPTREEIHQAIIEGRLKDLLVHQEGELVIADFASKDYLAILLDENFGEEYSKAKTNINRAHLIDLFGLHYPEYRSISEWYQGIDVEAVRRLADHELNARLDAEESGGEEGSEFLEYLEDLVEDFQRFLKRLRPEDNGPPVADLDKTYNAGRYKSREKWANAALAEMFNLDVLQSDYFGFKKSLLTLEQIASIQHCKDQVLIGGYSHLRLAKALSNCISQTLGGSTKAPKIKTILLDFRGEEIVIGNERFLLPGTAIKLFAVLLDKPGEWLPDKLIAAGRRTDKIVGRMPNPVQKLIESSRKGYRISIKTADTIQIIPR